MVWTREETMRELCGKFGSEQIRDFIKEICNWEDKWRYRLFLTILETYVSNCLCKRGDLQAKAAVFMREMGMKCNMDRTNIII
jgi:hypothetical protein